MPQGQPRRRQLDRQQLKDRYDEAYPAGEAALLDVYQQLRRLLEGHGLAPTIKYRVKRFDTYCEKLRQRGLWQGDEAGGAIRDLLGLRIICPFLEDIETIVSLVERHFEVLESTSKGSQHSFREFGYDSFHLLIALPEGVEFTPIPFTSAVCEIQLRTILQDAWAEVEHELVYKSDLNLPNESIRRKLASLNATLTLSDLIFQELRDYQKELRLRGQKRRESLARNLDLFDLFNMSDRPDCDDGLPTGPAPVSRTLASSLERTMLLALEAHSNDDLPTAIELYGQLLNMQLERPIRALVYNHRGMALFAQGQLEQAAKDFTKAIGYDPHNHRSYTNRGICYRLLKKHTLALADFDHALQVDPGRADVYAGRAQTHYELGQFALAQSDCRQALELDPAHKRARELQKRLTKLPT